MNLQSPLYLPVELTDAAVQAMSHHLNEYGASPLRAEIMQKRAVDNLTFYQVNLVFLRGVATSLLFGFDAEGRIAGGPYHEHGYTNGKAMKHMFSGFSLISALALLALAVGCASMQTQSKENLLIAAGFKVIVPRTAAQQHKLQALPADKVTVVQKNGKTYYVFPDAANNQAYVGGPRQFEAYKQLRLEYKLAKENLEAAELNQDDSMNWAGWGGFRGELAP